MYEMNFVTSDCRIICAADMHVMVRLADTSLLAHLKEWRMRVALWLSGLPVCVDFSLTGNGIVSHAAMRLGCGT